MSRLLGLREDQLVGAMLATRIAGLFPLDPVWCYREQARSHTGPASFTPLSSDADQNVGASLLAMRPDQSPPIQTGGCVSSIDGR